MSRRFLFSALAIVGIGLLAAAAHAQDAKSNSTTTPVPREADWVKRSQGFNEQAKKGNVDLIFIGDSITDGWRSAGKSVWEKYYAPRKALNLGIGGDRTQHVLWRLDNGNVDGIQPKLAVVMIGTNNAGINTPEEVAEGITQIVQKLRAKLPETKVLLLGIFPRGADKNDTKRQANTQTNQIIAKLNDGKMIFYLDIGPEFFKDAMGMATKDDTLSRDTMPSLLHPSTAGYEIWAKAIEPVVKQLMGEK